MRDTIPVRFDLPLNQSTTVTLTESVPLSVGATIVLPGVGQLNNAQVFLNLPAGLELPVQLDLTVPVTSDRRGVDARVASADAAHDPFNNPADLRAGARLSIP
ncbi:MAG: hypothetical protein LC121_25850 [Anaerolineae bacterium]|nr:hypothetical protein [Anaerolineae bacterium]